ncbi:hypothetical protein Golax_019364, partial [Gossypium laxum]|nr:hypothetical protein [Gossypium laxum]
MVLFSPHYPKGQRQFFGDLLGMKVIEKLDNYLGLPLPVGDIFHPKRVDKASFTWSIIAVAEDALKEEFGSQVGSGDCINIWIDNWRLEGLNGGVLNSNLLNLTECSVKDLWLEDCRCWNISRVHELYGQALWKLDTIPKVRVFTWHVGHEILPTNIKIASVQHGFGQGCPRYRAEYKTVIHALKDCPTCRAILSIVTADLMTTLWNCWNNRNNFLFKGKKEEAQQSSSSSSSMEALLKEYMAKNDVDLKGRNIARPLRSGTQLHEVINDATVEENSSGVIH